MQKPASDSSSVSAVKPAPELLLELDELLEAALLELEDELLDDELLELEEELLELDDELLELDEALLEPDEELLEPDEAVLSFVSGTPPHPAANRTDKTITTPNDVQREAAFFILFCL